MMQKLNTLWIKLMNMYLILGFTGKNGLVRRPISKHKVIKSWHFYLLQVENWRVIFTSFEINGITKASVFPEPVHALIY